ncbi:class I SAM-dependent methyltransferase [Pontibacter ruber]|uniref:Class I SAM-dependent methyltransferase n=1 Tax=Pontibacter ruber TaxID=1343895 RepID=A0ABW5CYD2_9BACT
MYLPLTLVSGSIIISLLVSLYIYDLSGFYNLDWVEQRHTDRLLVNINAGFDETSALLKAKFRNSELIVLDFYDPEVHTEVSIKRARKSYPPFLNTKQVKGNELPLPSNSADKILVILSAHEIRDDAERISFFKELARVLKPAGQVYVTEHLRDIPNFLAYNIGFLHFYSRSTWLNTFRASGLQVSKETKLTPFISTFILDKHGSAS